MAGGTWKTQDKVRPGAYVNVETVGGLSQPNATSGVVAMALPLGFGPEKEIIEITRETDLTFLGYELKDDQLFLLKEALKQASKVQLYRVGSGTKASAIVENLTVTCLYTGERGNDIHIVISDSVKTKNSMTVETYLEGKLIDSQICEDVKDLKPNQLVEFFGEGEFKEINFKLENGTTSPVLTADYMDYFSKAQVFDFNTMALPLADKIIKFAAVEFIIRLREDEGKKCQLVLSDINADSESVIVVRNGVILDDGRVVSANEATAWVAGASASAGVAKSLTYQSYDGAIDVSERFINSEVVNSLKNGQFLFTEKRGTAVIEQDINSLSTFTAEKNQVFSKNRVLRVLDDIANNTRIVFEDLFIGKIANTTDGCELFKANRIAYFDGLQAQGAITNFSAEDVSVGPGENKDTILMEVKVQPVDAMEKLYMTVEVQ